MVVRAALVVLVVSGAPSLSAGSHGARGVAVDGAVRSDVTAAASIRGEATPDAGPGNPACLLSVPYHCDPPPRRRSPH
jgi:hypothetical protein